MIIKRAFDFFLIMVLLPFVGVALFAKPQADDYCFATVVRDLGFLDAQLDWYSRWTGRYTSTALISLGEAIGEITGFIYPIMNLILLGSLFGAIYSIVKRTKLHEIGEEGALATALLLLCLYVGFMPSTVQGLYWQSGSFTYVGALISYLILLTLLTAPPASSKTEMGLQIALTCVLVIVSVGFNETILAVLLATLIFFPLAFSTSTSQRATYRYSLLISFTLAVTVLIAAPGNALRSARFQHTPEFLMSVIQSLYWALNYMLHWSNNLALWGSTVLLVPALRRRLVASRTSRPYGMYVLVLSVGLLIVIMSMFFPTYYLRGNGPTSRQLNLAFGVFLVGWFGVWAMLAAWKNETFTNERDLGVAIPIAAKAAIIISILNAPNMHDILRAIHTGPDYLVEVRERYLLIEEAKRQGSSTARVPLFQYRPRALYFDDITKTADDWRNRCYAKYFRISEIVIYTE